MADQSAAMLMRIHPGGHFVVRPPEQRVNPFSRGELRFSHVTKIAYAPNFE